MTRREICERLMEIRDQSSAGHLGPVGIRNALRDLILDLVVPEPEAETPQYYRCPACGFSPMGADGRYVRCPKCGEVRLNEQRTESDKLERKEEK